MHQEYYKTECMKGIEAHARNLENFESLRKVSMAASIVDG